jgi:bla regulator protein blaR1
MNALLQIGLTNAAMAAVLAVAAAGAGKICRRPALVHALWVLVLVKLVTPPLVVVPISLPEQSSISDTAESTAVQESATVPAEPERNAPLEPSKSWVAQPVPPEDMVPHVHAQSNDLPSAPSEPLIDSVALVEAESTSDLPKLPWLTLLGFAWLGGSCVWFSIALTRIWRFQQVLNAAQRGSAEFQQETNELGTQLGLRDCPAVWVVPGVVSPLLWAVAGYPRLLLPSGLVGRLDALQRRTLLAHELAHYRRRDHWVRCLEFLALGLYWWFPVVWWARRKLREAEEECCDGWVLWTLPEAAKAYASALVETLDFLSGSQRALPPVASGLGQLDLLRRRLAMIMRGNTPQRLGGIGLMTVVGLGALLLPLWPTWGQQGTSSTTSQSTTTGRSSTTTSGTAAQQSQDVDKARAELERANAELQLLRARLEEMRVMIEEKARKLQQAQAELVKAQAWTSTAKPTAEKKEPKKGFGGGAAFGATSGISPEMLKKIIEESVKSVSVQDKTGKMEEVVDSETLKKIIEHAVKMARSEAAKSGGGFGGFGGGSGFGTGGLPGGPGGGGFGAGGLPGGAGGLGGGLGGMGGGLGQPGLEIRMSNLEKKVERVLEELQAMRQAMPAVKKSGPDTPR